MTLTCQKKRMTSLSWKNPFEVEKEAIVTFFSKLFARSAQRKSTLLHFVLYLDIQWM